MEIFKDIQGLEGQYQISNLGNVKSLKRNKLLKPDVADKGYKRVSLSNDGKVTRYLIHRLVAEAFIDNPDNKPFINHKDNNPRNNHVSNLEWCTHSENMIHAHKQDRLANITASKAAIPVNQYRHEHIYKDRLKERFIKYYPTSKLDQTGRKKKSGSAVEYLCEGCSQPRIGIVDWKELREFNGLCPNCQQQVKILDEDIV